MMDHASQLELQAFFDGELPENEAHDMANRLARESDAAALLTELRNTSKALKGFESDIKLPESREFFWSKIERDIARLEQAEPAVRAPEPLLARWRRLLVPASAFAALVLMVVVAARQWELPIGFGSGVRPAPVLETALADSGAFTYRDQSEGITLVWLSYPGEKGVADSDPADTLQ
jgi:anti-sigma factor RsiW